MTTPTRIVREIPPEWQEVMELAERIPFGEIIIRIQDKKVTLVEYTVKRKPGTQEEFEVKIL